MPSPIQPDHVEAEYDKGVFNLTLPEADQEEKKSVKGAVS
ncbi:hypothetical protein C1752_08674 [Acaryochloris thomasi RCC1774]|uniref:Hsp20/alpha crystallin family protein n=1 Tax=Acaryochloris thomasi RCC1774 TaxID=1764569 RepID=A0A2W1J9G7_9CYAN|nr:hypothetical protein C1752_08674 [Acaryochloris thomasi RCC1774]